MAKRFFYISLGILCLAIAYNLGARNARADWDPSGFGIIAGAQLNTFWSQSGEAFELLNDRSWVPRPERDLPVSAFEIRMTGESTGGLALVTTSDDVWLYYSGNWSQTDPFPGSGTPVEKESWGGVKSRFR